LPALNFKIVYSSPAVLTTIRINQPPYSAARWQIDFKKLSIFCSQMKISTNVEFLACYLKQFGACLTKFKSIQTLPKLSHSFLGQESR
jgi:hypothetical protein